MKQFFECLQKNRESVEEFFASYQKVGEEVEKEDEGITYETDEEDKNLGEDEFMKKYLEPEETGLDRNKVKNKVKKIVREILVEVDRERSKIANILRVIDEGQDTDDTTNKLVALYVIHSATGEKRRIRGMDVQ